VENNQWHVIPIDDLREHDPEKGCWCNPMPDQADSDVLIHNALDRRDFLEENPGAFN
jgi:hypothetical protein